MLEDVPLDPATHDREDFECGAPVLDDYIRRHAEQQRRSGISSVFVLTDTTQPRHILGYYTLSAAEVDGERLTAADRKKLPRYPVPCFRMGRLACRLDQQGRGIGKLLVGCAVDRCLKARREVAAFALIVDAKDNGAAAFYMHFGFKRFVDAALTLYLPLGR